jgi:hypothetical protein
MMFLLPDDEDGEDIEEPFGYTMGIALESSRQQLHAGLVMSNHHHSNLTDPVGTLPDFKNKLHAFVARSVNAKRGRFDDSWSGDGPCDIEQRAADRRGNARGHRVHVHQPARGRPGQVGAMAGVFHVRVEVRGGPPISEAEVVLRPGQSRPARVCRDQARSSPTSSLT